jgi:hypothetical protein
MIRLLLILPLALPFSGPAAQPPSLADSAAITCDTIADIASATPRAADDRLQSRARRQLLLAAGRRCLRTAASKSEHVANWYCSYGPIQLLDRPLTLVLPLATVLRTCE